jgi:uncharacterized FlaG/YvyC family protein
MPGTGATAPAAEVRIPSPERIPSETRPAPESNDALSRAVTDINQSISQHMRHLEIRIHDATNRPIVTVYNSVTNEPIRTIPSEQILDAHANMLEMVGIFVNARG